jgi:adenylate cyclase class IV
MKFKEIEYKYWADDYSKEDFAKKIESVVSESIESIVYGSESGTQRPIYVVSCDDYYTRDNGDEKDFVRFRKGGGLYELTIKRKLKENIVRTEINLDVSANDDSAVEEFLGLSGYSKSFQVYKEAWIWNFNNCDVSYYTLSDGRNVIELESHGYTAPEEGVSIINDWAEKLGTTNLRRESRSLYEIFCEEGLAK